MLKIENWSSCIEKCLKQRYLFIPRIYLGWYYEKNFLVEVIIFKSSDDLNGGVVFLHLLHLPWGIGGCASESRHPRCAPGQGSPTPTLSDNTCGQAYFPSPLESRENISQNIKLFTVHAPYLSNSLPMTKWLLSLGERSHLNEEQNRVKLSEAKKSF